MNRAYYTLLFLVSFNVNSAELIGRIVNIHDGDTVSLLAEDNKTYKIRLEGVDAPELDQPFGKASKMHLSNLLLHDYGTTVLVTYKRHDKYGRVLGEITVRPNFAPVFISLNKTMVSDGYAWAFRKYSTAYVDDENKAKSASRGLWADTQPIPPWEWRASKRNKNVDRDIITH